MLIAVCPATIPSRPGLYVDALFYNYSFDKKEYEKAASYFQKAADHAKLVNISSRYQKLAGLAYEEIKEYEKALDCYQKVQKEYFNSDQSRDIEKYIERAKGLAKTQK